MVQHTGKNSEAIVNKARDCYEKKHEWCIVGKYLIIFDKKTNYQDK